MTTAAFSVGVTGGVGSGKSTIAAIMAEHGAGIVDADEISHRLTQANGAAIEALRAAFGAEAIAADGSLDRVHMRSRAFSDRSVRVELEALLHPMIRAAMRDRATALMQEGSPYVAFVVPLLVETGNWRTSVSRVLVIDCSEATQIARVCARPELSEATARKIIQTQASRRARLDAADDVLLNEAPLGQIATKVERLHRAYLRHADSPLVAARESL